MTNINENVSLSLLLRVYGALNEEDLRNLQQANAEGKLRQQGHLDISQNPIGYGTKGLSTLLSDRFPSLVYLILCSCGPNYWDLDSLAQAKLDGKLPAVKYIDIAVNTNILVLNWGPARSRFVCLYFPWTGSVACKCGIKQNQGGALYSRYHSLQYCL